MVVIAALALCLIGAAFYVGAKVVGPPRQPIGPYKLIERQVSLVLVPVHFSFL
jgi:hypothetical protein